MLHAVMDIIRIQVKYNCIHLLGYFFPVKISSINFERISICAIRNMSRFTADFTLKSHQILGAVSLHG